MSKRLEKGSDSNIRNGPIGASNAWGLAPFSVLGIAVLAIVLWITLGASVDACNVPVFRYALERWKSDDYQVVVFHEGSITETDKRFQAEIERGRSNVKLVFDDLTQPLSPHRQVFQSIGGPSTKSHRYFVVRAPRQSGRDEVVFHGIVDASAATPLLDSPIRQELSRRLLAGHAVVWLFLSSDNESQNQETRKLLSETIESLARRTELPEGIGQPGSELYSEVPLLSRFSLLEIKCDDSKELFLRKSFTTKGGGGVVIPVFGRGRALEVIPVELLTTSMIEDVTVYLSGACSCQVKDRNPGFDLLLAIDWERELFGNDQPPRFESSDKSQRPQSLAIPPGKASKP